MTWKNILKVDMAEARRLGNKYAPSDMAEARQARLREDRTDYFIRLNQMLEENKYNLDDRQIGILREISERAMAEPTESANYERQARAILVSYGVPRSWLSDSYRRN